MNKAQYFQFTKRICNGKAPSIKEATNEVGATLPELKQFMKQFFKEDDGQELDGNQEKSHYLQIYRMMQLRASQNAADLLVHGKITEKQAIKYLIDNSFSADDLARFKEHAEKMKKTWDRYNEDKEKRGKSN